MRDCAPTFCLSGESVVRSADRAAAGVTTQVDVRVMDARLVSFGKLEIDGRRFDHDVVVEGGRVRRRKKGPSKVRASKP